MSTLKLMGIQQWRPRVGSVVPAIDQVSPDSVPAPQRIQTDQRPEPTPQAHTLRKPEALPDTVPEAMPESVPEAVPEAVPKPKTCWDTLTQAIADQTGCQHCAAAQPMLGAGDKHANCVFIISMPSANDMQRQQLLSGRDGQLFDGMLRAMKLTREQVYLTSVCKCVVDNESASTRSCIPMVHQQIALVQPRVIISFGQQAAQWVIKSNENLSVLRSQAQKCHNTDVPVIVTHELSQLLAQPTLKAEAWHDLRCALRLLATDNDRQ